MTNGADAESRLRSLLQNQLIAVLSTSNQGEPYSCLVSYEVTQDLREIVFATMRQRLKYRNMIANPRVSLIIDNRKNTSRDLREATSATIIGTAEDMTGDLRKNYSQILLSRHPELEDFVSHPDCAVMRVRIDKVYIVSDFEAVEQIHYSGK